MTYRAEAEEEDPKLEEYPPGYGISGNGAYWGIYSNSKWFRRDEKDHSTTDKQQTVEYAWRAAWCEFALVIQELAENHEEINELERELRNLRKQETQLHARFEELVLPLVNHGFGPPLPPPQRQE